MTSETDLDFLEQVLLESACLDLEDCTKSPTASFGRDGVDHQGSYGAALAYPQLVALKSIERLLNEKNQTSRSLLTPMLEVLSRTADAPTSEVRIAVKKILSKYR
ncbi:MAG: hypothetical protein EOP04_27060 [Proteobacteria bacterium]|nr:MAG: hypothetical protein EOP04_27060 [Pseudomonadota bacterium]